MFTAFMDDAANIMSFHGDLNVEEGGSYAVELWIRTNSKDLDDRYLTKYFMSLNHCIPVVWLISNGTGKQIF